MRTSWPLLFAAAGMLAATSAIAEDPPAAFLEPFPDVVSAAEGVEAEPDRPADQPVEEASDRDEPEVAAATVALPAMAPDRTIDMHVDTAAVEQGSTDAPLPDADTDTVAVAANDEAAEDAEDDVQFAEAVATPMLAPERAPPPQVEIPGFGDAFGGAVMDGYDGPGAGAIMAEAFGPAVARHIAFGADPAAALAPVSASLTVESGDTLTGLFTEIGVGYSEAYAAIAALETVWDPRNLRAGQEIAVAYMPAPDPEGLATLIRFGLQLAYDRSVVVGRTSEGTYRAEVAIERFTTVQRRSAGTISISLFADGNAAGIPIGVLAQMTRAFSYDVDFQRSVQPDDGFEAMFTEDLDDDGNVVATGQLIYASMTLSGDLIEVFRFVRDDGEADYFARDGASVRKAIMRTPIDAARISSGFGMRNHPILGYSRMHAGVDFAAPTGTPIYAAGNGTVASAGWHRGYGNYIRIRHNGTLQTAYGHLSRFASGISTGTRVSQGQVIGYVGSTGLSTGPHLHYEVIENGVKVNPMQVHIPPGEPLTGADLERFRDYVAYLDSVRASMPVAGDAEITTVSTD